MDQAKIEQTGFAAGSRANDPMAGFSGQALFAIASGIVGLLTVGGGVAAALGAALGATIASSYTYFAAKRRH